MTKAPAIINDCSQVKRNYAIIDSQIHIHTVTIQNKDNAIYTGKEPVNVEVSYTAKTKINNLAFRMTVEAADKTVVGLATSKPSIESAAGENKADLALMLDWLAPGKYLVKLTAYSVNQFGTNQMHDIVEEAFAFEKVQSSNENNNMAWNHTWWGYMMFPEITIGKGKKCYE